MLKKNWLISFFKYALLVFGMVLTLTPMLYLISYSLRPNSAIYQYPPTLFPEVGKLTLENYYHILINKKDIYVYFLNSLTVTGATVLAAMFVSSSLAYCIARFRFPGRNVLFSLIMATMIIPGLALIIPQFELAVWLGFIDKLYSLIPVYVAWVVPFSTFMIKGFVEDIPKDFDDAVYIDGGSVFTVYARIILPLASPALAAVSVFNFLTAWEEYPWALTVLSTESVRTLPIYIAGFFGRNNFTQYGYIFAMSVISLIPVVIMFIALQRFFVSGLSAGAIKG